jgi:hypothetical protein
MACTNRPTTAENWDDIWPGMKSSRVQVDGEIIVPRAGTAGMYNADEIGPPTPWTDL